MPSPGTFSQSKDHQVVNIQRSRLQSPREQEVYLGVSIGNVGSGAGATAFFSVSSSHCFIFLFLLFYLFGHAIWLAGFQFPNQGSNPSHQQLKLRVPTMVSLLCQVYSGIKTRSQRVYAVPGYCRARDWANQTATCLMYAQKHCP